MKVRICPIVNQICLLPLMHCLCCFVFTHKHNRLPLGRYEPSSTISYLRSRATSFYLNVFAWKGTVKILKMNGPTPGPILVYFPSLKSNFYRKIAPRLQRALNSDRRSRSWAAWPLYQHHCPTLLCCQNDKNIILIHENSTKMSWIGAKYV